MRYEVDVKEIVYLPAAQKALLRMPGNTSARIRIKIQAYAADPGAQANNVKAMADGRSIRLRVGDWRVIMCDNEVLEVSEIGPRGSIYG